MLKNGTWSGTIDSADIVRKRLHALRAELEQEGAAGEEAGQVVELDQTRVGRLSRMDAMQAQAMSQASSRRRKRQLAGIVAALARLDRDEYGVCLDCDEDIPDKRLQFDPTVTLCVNCAAKAEQ